MASKTLQRVDSSSDFPADLRGKNILIATESLGPVNGVSRTTQSLVDFLRLNDANVATCAPRYAGQHICSGVEVKHERHSIINSHWVRSVQAKAETLGTRALGAGWTFHHERDQEAAEAATAPATRQPRTRILNSVKNSKPAALSPRLNPEFRLQGISLPYNPDLTVAYPFRMGVVHSKTFKPDLIYLASPASVGFQFLVQLAQLDNPPPTMLNFQTDLSHYATILFASPIDKYAVWLLQYVQGSLFSIPAVQKIFYPSAYVRKYMESCGAPTEKMEQLGRGVDTQLFNPSRRDAEWRKELAPNGETIFCCISRIAPEKGFSFLADAAKKLKESGLPFKLLIVGGNKNPAVDNEVRRYFKDLSDCVIFTGMLRGEALARAYATADVFLHCSITETFGLVVLESMASGVPVIARDEGGPSETVQHGTSGFLVPPADLETFVKYARQLATDAQLRSQMTIKARQQAEETTWDKINNRVAEQMAEAIAKATPRPTEEDCKAGCYGSWVGAARVYFAVGIVWLFWFIAVIPMLICGYLHG